MSNTLTSGTVQKAAGDSIRLPMDFGDIPQLIDGASVVAGALVMAVNIASYDVVAAGLTVTNKQKDYGYQISAKFSGGPAGTYDCVFTITLDDADGTQYSRTGPLRVV